MSAPAEDVELEISICLDGREALHAWNAALSSKQEQADACRNLL